jgi:peroxiredoxin
LALILALASGSCSRSDPAPPAAPAQAPAGYGYVVAGRFKDDVATNTKVAATDLDLVLKAPDGKSVDLKQYRGKKNLVLVIMRGYPGFVCPNCSAQTSRLVSNYEEFVKRNTEIVVVYPGPAEHLQEYINVSRAQAGNLPVPFPILLDEKFAAVDRLGIRGDLAKPSTYILDKEGQVRFAYVGATTADRPSLKAILQQLDAIPST